MPAIEVPIEKWIGKVNQVTLGAGGRKTITVGGESTLPFLKLEGSIPHRTAVAIEIQDKQPKDFPPHLASEWGDALKDPAKWAKKAADYGADVIILNLRSANPEEGNTGATEAKKHVAAVLEAVDLPVIVTGPGIAEKDNEVLVAASEVGRGQRLALGNCEEKNYRTIAATCIVDGHIAIGNTPIEINLAKQLNILLCEVGMKPDSILMDPTTGALGYGLEYTYTAMERLRLACLMGDSMTSMPMICSPGESWKQKEAKAVDGMPISWGDHKTRSIVWEEMTAIALLNAGADILVMRHPKAVELIKATIGRLVS